MKIRTHIITVLTLSYILILLAGCKEKMEKDLSPSPPNNESIPEATLPLVRTLGMGWNLGNQLDAHANGTANETIWGNQAATQATFDKLAEADFASVRIPVTWLGKVGPAPDYAIDSDWLNRVAELVDYEIGRASCRESGWIS